MGDKGWRKEREEMNMIFPFLSLGGMEGMGNSKFGNWQGIRPRMAWWNHLFCSGQQWGNEVGQIQSLAIQWHEFD